MVEVSRKISSPITIDTSVKGSAERVDSAFFSSASSSASSNSLTDDCHAVTPVPKGHHSFAKFFSHANHGKKSSSVHDPDNASLASTPDSKSGHKFMMAGLKRQKTSKGSFFEKEDCDLNKKYGVCDRGWIGKGATATIRLCHKSDKSGREKLYAVKEFRHRKKDESEKEYVKKLTSEFCISSSLHHVNVVETVDLVKDDKDGWVTVMEYVPFDLYTVIKSGAMTNVEVNCCFKQLVHGVAYMHSMGVAHRDLKPENLLLNEHGQLKIADFGISDVFRVSWEKHPHMSTGLCGSEPYIAPEQFESSEYDAQMVDIWSMGIVYFCMALEGTPFRAAQASDPGFCRYLEAHPTRSYSSFKKLTKPCRSLMYRILDPNPKKRITIAEILENDWFKSIEVCSDCQAASGEHNHIPSSCHGPSTKSKH